MKTIRQIVRALKPQLWEPGLKTKRACNVRDILIAIRESRHAKRRVRVYGSAGFVPNSYKYACHLQYIEGQLDPETGEWTYYVGYGSAQRTHGRGKLVVVQ